MGDGTRDDGGKERGRAVVIAGLVAKPFSGAAGLVSRAGRKIISSTGLEHGLLRKHTSLTHSHLLYENSLTKISCKILHTEDCLLSLNCELVSQVGIHLQVVWVLTMTTLYVVRCEDEVIDSMASIDDIDMYVEHLTHHGLITVKYVPTVDEFTAKQKVADYLGVKVTSQRRNKRSESNEYPVYSAICTDLTKMNLFLQVFHAVKHHPGNFPW